MAPRRNTPTTDESREYNRGKRQGEITSELAQHAEHLSHINGSMETVANKLTNVSDQLSRLLQAIARIDQAMTADKETVLQTAAALKDQADVAGRRDSERWTPFTRAMVGISGLAGAAGVVYLFVH